MVIVNTFAKSQSIHRQLWICRVILVGLVVATFGRLLAYDYVQWDDPGTIFENPDLVSVSARTFADAWTKPHMAIFIPVTHTAWAIFAAVAGHATPGGHEINAAPFRVLSLLLHCGSTLLVFHLIRRIAGTTPGALLGAAIFAIHPIQTEAVAWISGEKDLFAGFFLLAATSAAIRAAVDDVRRKSVWTLATMLLGILAMLSKPQAITVVPVIVLTLRACAVPWRRAIALAASLALPAIVVAIIGRNVQPASTVPDVAIPLRPIVALDALGWYVRKLLWPTDFALDYGHTPRMVLPLVQTYLIAASVTFAIVLVWLGRRRLPLIAYGLALSCCGPLPVLGLLKFDFQYYSTVADHYAYVGMFGIGLTIAALYQSLRGPMLQWLPFTLIVPLAILSFWQAGVWRGTDELFSHNLAVNPIALGPTRVLAFRAANAGDDREAIRLLNVTLQTYPLDAMANYNLANALVRLGRYDEAVPAFQRAIATTPRIAPYRHNYAILLIRLGRLDEAAAEMNRAVELDPGAVESREALAKLQALRVRASASQPAVP